MSNSSFTFAAVAIALVVLVPGRGEAQVPIPHRDSLQKRLQSQAVTMPSRCAPIALVPGDTAGRRMPRASGDTLVGRRMPRSDGALPSCETMRTATGELGRVQRLPDGTYRLLPMPGVRAYP